MNERLLRYLRCPECGAQLARDGPARLRCDGGHTFPVIRGVPRMLPARELDSRTRESFSQEWALDRLDGRVWGMDVDQRVRVFFLEPLGVPVEDLRGKVMLDAGCGTGSQSAAYTAYGLEVIALDLSDAVDAGQGFASRAPGARPERAHFVQADLCRPPLAPGTVDVIHSVGVLHHTPDTLQAFRSLVPLLREGGTFYVWLYRREPYVTGLMNAIRAITTRVPARAFAKLARALAPVALVFRKATTMLRLRGYPSASRAEAAHALIDTFGSPHRHCHSCEEVESWFAAAGFPTVWRTNEGRRGFGVCGRLPLRTGPALAPTVPTARAVEASL
jgi:SAM-dependent methyltransferase